MSGSDHTDGSGGGEPTVRAATGAAVASGGFCLVVCALLAANYLQMRGTDLRESDQLNALKSELFKRPGDEQLKERIRKLDLRLRLDHFRRRRFAATGAWLLLGGAAVFAISIKVRTGARRAPAGPEPRTADAARPARAAAAARRAVTATAAAVAAGAVIAALTVPIPLGEELLGDEKVATRAAAEPPSPKEVASNWPRFRGPGGDGVSAHANFPMKWDAKTGQGVLWKTPVPLPGENSPVVWQDRVFLTGATREKRQVFCFDAGSGKLLWERAVTAPGSPAEPPEVMEDTGFAAPTAATDGRRVYAIFANGDLGCFDFAGKPVWARSLGVPENTYGHASSLAMYRNLLLVQFDQGTDPDEGKSEIVALDGATGKPVWVTPRPVVNSWTTPIVVETGSGPQLITSADPWVISYSPADGKEIWRAECISGDAAPSPVFAAGLVFAVNTDSVLAAIRADGKGDVTKTHVVWTVEDDLPDICSPLSDGKRVYMLTTDGLLTCHAVKDGKKLWEKDFEIMFHSSPSLVGDRIYLQAQRGAMWIVAAADEYRQLSQADLGENVNTSPAFADGRIYVRGKKHLFCIGERR